MSIYTWVPGLQYTKGEAVFHAGTYYQATADTSAAPPSSPWTPVTDGPRFMPPDVWALRPKHCRPAFLKWWIDLQERYYEAEQLRQVAERRGPVKPIKLDKPEPAPSATVKRKPGAPVYLR